MVADTAVSVPTRNIADPAPTMPRLWKEFMPGTVEARLALSTEPMTSRENGPMSPA
ncbi:hypothetical protein GCM10022254_04850 [Actinomadura meridiana]|uniref:Uncharacterized protein n=1 Tax=Actinomadura meridiana TaxID=559626 RepID=A0ABP8BSE8_9ACTN